jgi:hypothetical protein
MFLLASFRVLLDTRPLNPESIVMTQTPNRVAVTGADGQIGYTILIRIASGEMFGPDQPVILHLI